MDIFTQENEDIPLKHFTIIRDDIDIGRRKLTSPKHTGSLESEVDSLLHRLRRLEEAQRLSKSNLKGSIDKGREHAKVHFADSVSIKFFKQEERPRHSVILEHVRASMRKSVETPVKDFYKKRISLQVDEASISSDGTSPVLKSVLKGSPSSKKVPLKILRSQDILFGQESLHVESEVDTQTEYVDAIPSLSSFHENEEPVAHVRVKDVNEALDVPQVKKKRRLRCFLCCRRKSKRHRSYYPDKVKNVEFTTVDQGENSAKVSEPPNVTMASRLENLKLQKSEMQKLKYFRDHRKPSTDQRNIARRVANFLKGK